MENDVMNNFNIKPNTFSIGYNLQGQGFFDTINKYRDYIHSYFFSLTHNRDITPLNQEDVSQILKSCNTFDIPANLLLNTPSSEKNYDELIQRSRALVNLNSVTALTPKVARRIKDKYPDLIVHLSVQYANKYTTKNLEGAIDYINISGAYDYNNIALMESYKQIGIGIKFIVNEGCMVERSNNISKFPEFKNRSCCDHVCMELAAKHPWTELCRINLFKESLVYYDIDILKFSTRDLSNQTIDEMLEYWTSPDKTAQVLGTQLDDKTYPAFLDWIKERSHCSNKCYSCQKCKEYHNKMKGGL